MEKKKKALWKRWWFWVIVVIVVGAIGSNGDSEATEKASEPASAEVKAEKTEAKPKEEPKQEAPKEFSKEGVSSDVKIVVGAVETKDAVGDDFTKETAQGVFKIVEISITNNQKDAITVDANSFKLVDDQGREFTYSVQAQTALDIANGNTLDFFLKQLNPGLTQTGKIVYDVPKDAKGLVLKARGGMTGKEITLKVE